MLKYILLSLFVLTAFPVICHALPDKSRKEIEKYISEKNYDSALKILSRLPGELQHDTEALLLKGICYYRTDSLRTQAPGILRNAYAQNQETSLTKSLLYHLAKAYTANEEYIEAIKTYNKLQQSIPDTAVELLNKIEEEIDFCNTQLQTFGTVPKTTISKTASPSSESPVNNVPPEKQNHTDSTENGIGKNSRYTIQICSMSFPLSDSFFKGQYGIKVMRMGDLYRYIYSIYNTLPEARQDLPKVRKIYPDAFIREFDEEKLGKAIDLNIEKLK